MSSDYDGEICSRCNGVVWRPHTAVCNACADKELESTDRERMAWEMFIVQEEKP